MTSAVTGILALALVATPPAAAAFPTTATYALVVTNNRSLSLERPDLHYADDDGVQYAELFADYFGGESTRLLTSFDPDSRPLYPRWAARARPPTLANLRAATADLAARIRAAHEAGATTVVYVVFAGHGDVRHGQGFVDLQDGSLDAATFEREVVGTLKAGTVHIVLDSCNSYFMLNPRKPGGKRWRVGERQASGLLARKKNVGGIISTSAEAVTFEWSDIQSGIFSYVVRSGLRGAADVNGDRVITYDELGAFVATATKTVVNELYRPRIFFAGPREDDGEAFMVVPSQQRRLELAAGESRRLNLRSAAGVRLLDLHKEEGLAVTLNLPPDEGEITLIEQHRDSEGRAQLRELALPAGGPLRLSELQPKEPDLAPRSASAPFETLFSAAWGPLAFGRAMEARASEREDCYGVTMADAARLQSFLSAAGRLEHDARSGRGLAGMVGAAALGTVAVGLAAGVNDPEERRVASGLAVGGTAALLGASLISLLVPSGVEELAESYRWLPLRSEEQRAWAVVVTERAFAEEALARARRTRYAGWTLVGAAGVLGLTYGGLAIATGEEPSEMTSYAAIAAGVGLLGAGAYLILGYDAPSERLWRLYELEDTVTPLGELPMPHDESRAPMLMPLIGATGGGAPVLGLGGLF